MEGQKGKGGKRVRGVERRGRNIDRWKKCVGGKYWESIGLARRGGKGE